MTTLERMKKAKEKCDPGEYGMNAEELDVLKKYSVVNMFDAFSIAFHYGFTRGKKAAEKQQNRDKGEKLRCFVNTSEPSRKQAIERLCKLSPEALDCVLKPIEWAYNWYDGHDQDGLSIEEAERFQLFIFAIGANKENFQAVNKWRLYYQHKELEERRKGAKRT